MNHRSDRDYAGSLHEHIIESVSLTNNPLGDSASRLLVVYTPPGYEDHPDRSYPSIYVIQGYTGQVEMWWNRSPFKPRYPKMVDEVFATTDTPPCLVVYVDAWTSYGGSQFVDSIGTGRYHTYLCDDVVSFVDAHYRTIKDAAHRGIQGKSSGGFGAMITPMLRPDVFGAFASHAGDSLYELCYGSTFGDAARLLRSWDGSPELWWNDFRSRPAFTHPADMSLLSLYGVAACFSPDRDGRPVLPFDTRTGRQLDDVWAQWLEWDPVRMVRQHAAALRGLKGIWMDAGKNDEYYLDLGAQAVVDELSSIGVHDVTFELFEGTHGGIDYRYPLSLAFLADRLQP